MYTEFSVKNFRCFHDLDITQLDRINLFTGMNNVGKTALLEALFIHCGAYNPQLALRINAFRGIELVRVELGPWTEHPWDSIFYEFDKAHVIELKGKNSITGARKITLRALTDPSELTQILEFIQLPSQDGQKIISSPESAKVLELHFEEEAKSGNSYMIMDEKGIRMSLIPPAPPFSAFFQPAKMRIPLREDSERFSNLEIHGRQEILVKALKIVEPRLKKLSIIVSGGEPTIHGDIGAGRMIPLPVMGEGMVRLSNLVLHIANAPNGVFLVDEIENGLHYLILPKVWRAIKELAIEFNVQIFSTTHSLECISAAHNTFEKDKAYSFVLHRLERVDGKIRDIAYDKDTLSAAFDSELEVR